MSSKSILIVAPAPTHPTLSGNRTVILAYTELLKSQGHDLTYFWVAYHNADSNEVQETTEYWGGKLHVYKKGIINRLKDAFFKYLRFKITGYYKIDDLYPIGLDRSLKRLLNRQKFDAVIINYIFLSRAAKLVKNAKRILYTHDVFTNKYQMTGSDWFSVRPNQESRALDRFDSILSIQMNESIFYQYLTRRKVITTYSYFKIKKTPVTLSKRLLYLGGSNQYNITSLRFFLESIYPSIVSAIPDIELVIGGGICKAMSEFAACHAIHIFGEVDNLSDFYSLGDIVINPTQKGTGLKIKTFEALAHGRVQISHPHGIIGIYNPQKAPIHVAVEPKEYVNYIKRYLNNRIALENAQNRAYNYIGDLNSITSSGFTEALNNE